MDESVFFYLSDKDLQDVAKKQLKRKLLPEEVTKIRKLVSDRINWYEPILDVIREEIER